MTTITVSRETANDGSTVLHAGRASFRFRRPRPGVIDITIQGIDNGQFGTAALDELAMALVRERPLEVFVDASAASMPAVSVSRDWARFFALNQKDLKRASMMFEARRNGR